MKKTLRGLCLILAVGVVLGAVSCGTSGGGDVTDAPETTIASDTSVSTVEVTTADTTALTTEVTTEPIGIGRDDVTQTEPETTEAPTVPDVPDDGDTVPIVYMYHLIMEEPYSIYDGLFVRPSEFSAHLDAMNEAGVSYIFADEYRLTDGQSVVLTFDDGYEDNYTTMFPILKEKGAVATIFLISDFIGTDGYLNEDQIREMADSGLVRFGCHTKTHRNLATLSEDEVRYELTESVSVIQSIVGYEIHSLAYPTGGFNDTVTAVASELFEFAYTTKSPAYVAADNMMTIPRYGVYRGYGPSFITGTIPG